MSIPGVNRVPEDSQDERSEGIHLSQGSEGRFSRRAFPRLVLPDLQTHSSTGYRDELSRLYRCPDVSRF